MSGLRILTTDPAQDCIEACLIASARAHAYLKPGRNDNERKVTARTERVER